MRPLPQQARVVRCAVLLRDEGGEEPSGHGPPSAVLVADADSGPNRQRHCCPDWRLPKRAIKLAHHKALALVVRERRSERRAFAVAVTQSGRERPPSRTCLSVRTVNSGAVRRCRPDTTLRAALSAMGVFRLLLFEQRLPAISEGAVSAIA